MRHNERATCLDELSILIGKAHKFEHLGKPGGPVGVTTHATLLQADPARWYPGAREG
jgi:hypothetical protein